LGVQPFKAKEVFILNPYNHKAKTELSWHCASLLGTEKPGEAHDLRQPISEKFLGRRAKEG
jgi:hypothetical protein